MNRVAHFILFARLFFSFGAIFFSRSECVVCTLYG